VVGQDDVDAAVALGERGGEAVDGLFVGDVEDPAAHVARASVTASSA